MNDVTPIEKHSVSIGLLAALVATELESFAGPLLAAGWKRELELQPRLRAAQIEQWHKDVAGVTVNIYTGAIGRMGQAAAAIETFAFLERVHPSIVFLCGIAGSLDRKTFKKRDVVVARHVHWKGENKIEDGSPCRTYRRADYLVPNLDVDVINKIEATLIRLKNARIIADSFDVHVSEIFSWDYVTSGQSITQEILAKHPKAACVEMEGGGFLAAVERYHKVRGERPILGLVVRGISDYTELKDSDEETRKGAARNAALVCAKLAEDAFDPAGSDLVAGLLA